MIVYVDAGGVLMHRLMCCSAVGSGGDCEAKCAGWSVTAGGQSCV